MEENLERFRVDASDPLRMHRQRQMEDNRWQLGHRHDRRATEYHFRHARSGQRRYHQLERLPHGARAKVFPERRFVLQARLDAQTTHVASGVM